MNFRSARKLVDKAIIEQEKQEQFKLYLVDRQNMRKIISFEEYLSKVGFTKHINVSIDKRKSEEIYNEIEEIYKKFEAQKES